MSGIAAAGSADSKCTSPSASVPPRSVSPTSPIAHPDDLLGLVWRAGHPIRATVAEMGPLLAGSDAGTDRDAQEGVISIAFRIADEQGLPLLD